MGAEFARLRGRWSVDRALEPGLGRFAGRATFRPAGLDRLHYRETGTVALTGGWSGDAYREQVWVLDGTQLRIHLVAAAPPGTGSPDPSVDPVVATTLDVAQPLGAVLHALPVGVLTGADIPPAVHHCGADVYTGTYRFRGPDRITVRIEVTGPVKDYRTRTELCRLPGA